MRDPNAKTLVNVALVKEMRARRGGKPAPQQPTPDVTHASVPSPNGPKS